MLEQFRKVFRFYLLRVEHHMGGKQMIISVLLFSGHSSYWRDVALCDIFSSDPESLTQRSEVHQKHRSVKTWISTDPSPSQQSRVSLSRYPSHQRQLQDDHMQSCCCGVPSDDTVRQPATHTTSTQQVQQELRGTHTHKQI